MKAAKAKGATVEALRALKPAAGQDSRRALSVEEGLEALRAYRRGVPLEQIARALDKGRGSFYSLVGTWALRHCRCPERDTAREVLATIPKGKSAE